MIFFIRLKIIFLLVGIFLSFNILGINNKNPRTRILLIFDASKSMSGKWQSGTKMDVAKKLLFEFLDSLRNDTSIEMGLRLYGHQSKFPPQDCNDTKLEIPISKNSIYNIKKKLKSIEPSGTTPLARSLMESINDFGVVDDKSKNVIIIITDGIEECGGDPCAVSYELQKKGIFLKPFIVGIGEDMKNKFDCVGEYFDASNE